MFLKKLDYQMTQHNLTKHGVAKATEIPYTTIMSWYDTKNNINNIRVGNLRKLSSLFEVSLDYWFDNNLEYLPEQHPTKELVYNKEQALKEMLDELNQLTSQIEKTLEQPKD